MSRPISADAPDAIAVIGMSGRFPGAPDLVTFWDHLAEGVESIRRFSRDELLAAGVEARALEHPGYVPAAGVLADVGAFDASLFGYSPAEASLIDPQQRQFLECAWAALEHAGYPPRGIATRVGVFAGSGLSGYLLHHVLADPALLERVGPYQAIIGNDKDFLATRVAYKLGLEGPALTVQTACSTSLVAVCAACQSLMSGECDLALAGGVSVRVPHEAGYVYQEEGILSPDGHCRPFDAAARGTVPGSGVGVLVLKPLALALADRDRVHAVIRGWAVNNDGARKVGFTAPSADGQAAAVAEALALADLDSGAVSYIETHGTGTRLGDPIEIAALSRVFGGRVPRLRPCAIGSLKSNVGHLDAAAGVAGVIKTVLALEHRELPPTLHFQRMNPEVEDSSLFRVVTERTPWEGESPRRAGVSSFGIGGTNAHVVLEEGPEPPASDPGPGRALLVLSARNEGALDRAGERLAKHLEADPATPIHDVAYTLQTGRVAMDHRRAVVCADASSGAAALSSADRRRVRSGIASGPRPVAFLFPGQGSQHFGMGASLAATMPRFAEELDRCAGMLSSHLGLDLRDALFGTADSEVAARALDQTALAQPALFAIEYALGRCWMDLGVRPDAMLGHSVGEYVAACLAGAIALEDALRVVAARGRLMQTLPPGAMMAVPLDEPTLASLLPAELSLAAVNAPDACTISGPPQAIDGFAGALAGLGVEFRRLHTSHAFHSGMMDPVLDPFRAELTRVTWRTPEIRWISNVTGTWIEAEQARNPEYWVRHLRATVRFAEGAGTLLATHRTLLEVGPGQTLASLVRRQPSAAGATILSSMPHAQEGADELEAFLRAVADLWVGGVPIDWPALHRGRARNRVPVPTYPFDRTRHWLESRHQATRSERPGRVVKRADTAEWFYVPSWKRIPPCDPRTVSSSEHWLLLEDVLGVGSALAEILKSSGARVSRVRPGDRFERVGAMEYRIAPSRLEDHQSLFAALQEEGGLPQSVVHLWSLEGESPGAAPDRAASSLLACVRTIAPLARGSRIQVAVVSDGLQSVTGGEPCDPERASVLGLCKVVMQEHPNLPCRSIDVLSSETSRGDAALALSRELLSLQDGVEIALRNGHRWAPTYEPMPLLRHEPGREGPLRSGAHVLITGGLGRFGMTLATHLARTRQAKLTLLDRRILPDRALWETLAAGDGDEDAVTARALLELSATGVPFRAVVADVSDAAAVSRAVSAAELHFGPVEAVFHAAGPPDESAYATIEELTSVHLAAHAAAKIAGLRSLEAAFDRRPPGIAVVCSSLAPILGGLGLAAMAAADRSVAALVERAHQAGRIRWRSIDWEGWEQRWADPRHSVLGRSQSELMLSWPEVTDAVERILGAPEAPRVIVATGDLEERRRQWTRIPEDAARQGGVSAQAPSPKSGPPSGHGTEDLVSAIWGEALGLSSVGPDDDFFELGGNSLLGLQILSRLRGEFQVELSLRGFFEARTIRAMAAFIDAERAASDDQNRSVTSLLDEIESLTDEEVERRLMAEGLAPPPHSEKRMEAAPTAVENPGSDRNGEGSRASMRFSLFFFSADGAVAGAEKYRLVLDCARFGDRHGFDAVWTPERHFVEFGGLYPNPAVLGAALAVATQRIQIRAGSVVLPLHHPIRVAEEWSVVDNLSGGRAAISCASGWHPDDFVLAPEDYADRKNLMIRNIDLIRRLWAGESVMFPGIHGDGVPVRMLPRPVQPSLPIWVTTSGNVETWELAGDLDAHVLATLGNQTIEELGSKVARYREARARRGHDPAAGIVTIMLHTHIGPDPDVIRARVREPLAEYLRTHLAQRDRYVQIDRITERDKQALADLAVEHYLEHASLLGTPQSCSQRIDRLASVGVDEIACLLDFGLDPSHVLAGLEPLDAVRAAHAHVEVGA